MTGLIRFDAVKHALIEARSIDEVKAVRDYDFSERLKWSEGFLSVDIEKILQSRIPGCTKVTKASDPEDRSGTTCWL